MSLVFDKEGMWRVDTEQKGFTVDGLNVIPIEWYDDDKRLSPSLRESYEEIIDSESSEYNSLKNSGIFREKLTRSQDEESAIIQARLTACTCALNVLIGE